MYLRAAAVVGSLAVALGACDDEGAAGTSSTTPGGEGGTRADEGPWTLDNYCARAAPKFCAAVRSCCEEDFDYEAAGCAARWTQELCEPAVAMVRSGALRFPLGDAPTRAAGDAIVNRCFDAFAVYASTCGEATFYDYIAWRDQSHVDCRMFDGFQPLGAPCDRRVDCASAGRSAFVGCFDGQCAVGELFQPGRPCPSSDTICDGDTYCNAPPSGGWGTCVASQPLGAPCLGIDDVSDCGQTAHCDLIERVCRPNEKVTEGPCFDGRRRECRSLACRAWTPTCAHPISWDDYPDLGRVHLDDQLCGRPEGVNGTP
ncbi:MAG: hypothetical protein AAF928_01700 [Myxococcota bacterium]